jgi:hypothetical protein
MGQYYYAVILDAQGKIVVWMNASPYGSGVKLMEHSYIDNAFVNTFEFSLSPEGALYKSRVVWAGDYADNEPGQENNLHQLCNEDETKLIAPAKKDTSKYRYLVNHTKRQYVDKTKTGNLHPLPLMTVEGNGRGCGDIYDAPSFVGSWARDVISVEEEVPDTENFQEIVFDLGEERA